MFLNLKAAKAVGVAVPLPLLGRADEVIEAVHESAFGTERTCPSCRSMSVSLSFKLRLFGRGVRFHSDDVLASFFICQRDRPNAFLKGGRRYGDFCSGNPSPCTREVSRRDAPVSPVCKRRDTTRVYPYELRGCRSLLGFWR